MPTVSPIVLEHHQKEDKTWNVKIRISHKGQERYLNTGHFVVKSQLDKKFKIKDTFLLDLMYPVIKKYREAISAMSDIKFISAAVIKDRLEQLDQANFDSIDFFSFADGFIEAKFKQGKDVSARGHQTIVNSLRDFTGREFLDIREINSSFLQRWESYLRTEREILRKGRIGAGMVKYKIKPVSDSGLYGMMRDLRLLFNAARERYNDEDSGIIKIAHYPFKKYKLTPPPLTRHRNRTVEELVAIRDAELKAGSRAELARDIFMLSFYLCGMNAADLYELPAKSGEKKRIEYNRAKTRGKRRDKSFISIKNIPESKALLEKYAGALQKRYSSRSGFNKAIDMGLREVTVASAVSEIDFYDARHSVGSLARNVCGFSKDDVAAALNHTQRSITDIYIAPDWSVVDRVQEALVNLLRQKQPAQESPQV